MSFLRFSDLQSATQFEPLHKSASAVLKEERSQAPENAQFDIFLCHSFKDADKIFRLKRMIEREGLTVYVDWVTDPDLERTRVDQETAKRLRTRMNNSSNLVYADSATAEESKWMPWELGFFDGIRPSHIFVLPLVMSSDSEYKGREYLNLYPKVDAIRELSGQVRLGFEEVKSGTQRRTIMLKDAANGNGVYLS